MPLCVCHILLKVAATERNLARNLYFAFLLKSVWRSMHFKKHPKTEAPKKIDSSTTLKWTTNGLLLPHEIFGSLYHYQDGHLFFSLLAGLPGETWQHHTRCKHVTIDKTRAYGPICVPHSQAQKEYWSQNRQLEVDLREYWRQQVPIFGFTFLLMRQNLQTISSLFDWWFLSQDLDAPATMSYVIPVRLYGDGADAYSPKLITCHILLKNRKLTGSWLRPPILRTSFPASSAQSIFIVCRQSNCVPSQGSFAVAPKNAYIPRSRTATWGWAWETLLHPRRPGAFYICIQYMHWFVCEIMRQRSYHNRKGPENQQEIQNHDHGADPMVYESSLHHGHELVDIKASHIYICFTYIM